MPYHADARCFQHVPPFEAAADACSVIITSHNCRERYLVREGLSARLGTSSRRLLWVDTVEILWVIILSTYGQHQRQAVAAADTALAVHAEPGLPEQLLPQEVPVVAVPVLPVAAE